MLGGDSKVSNSSASEIPPQQSPRRKNNPCIHFEQLKEYIILLLSPYIMCIRINQLPEFIRKYQAIKIETTRGRSQLCDKVAHMCNIL